MTAPRRIVSPGCALAVALTGNISSSSADERLSMTGSYQGGFACEQTNDGAPGGFLTPAELKIVQRRSDRLDLELTFDIPGAGLQTLLFNGEIRADTVSGTVSGYFESCGGSFEAVELARILPAEAISDDFTFAADSTFRSTDTPPPLEGQLVVASCRYVFTRQDRARPRLQTCD